MNIKGIIDFGLKHFGEVYTVIDVLGNILGKTAPADAPEKLKGFYGLFGKEDERGFQHLLLKIDDVVDQQMLLGFIQWYFLQHKDKSLRGAATVWWAMNAWRTFVVKLSSKGSKKGQSTTTVTGKDANGDTVKTVTTGDIFSPSGEQSIEFLKRIITIIKSEGIREDGYRKVVEYFEAAGVPGMPDEKTLRWINSNWLTLPIWSTTKKKLNEVNAALAVAAKETRRREAALPWWRRWLRA